MDSIIKIESKPIEKLIEVVSEAIGTLYEPRQIVRKAKAEAKAQSIVAMEQAKTKAIIEGDAEKAQYLDAINERLIKKEKRRQKNIEEVVSTAGQILEAEKDVPKESVNPDWAIRFFDIVQDVSDNEMQLLWGQILAGEVKRPKSFSLRTLETLRNMTKEEAEMFQKIVQFALRRDELFVFSEDRALNGFGITYYDIAKLVEIGLLQAGDFVNKIFPSVEDDTEIGFVYGNNVIIIKQKSNSKSFGVPVRLFTVPGQELSKLVNVKPNIDYIKELSAFIKKKSKAEVQYAVIDKEEDDGSIVYHNPIDL